MNLTTNYMGLQLKHPVVPSASPLSYDLAGIKKLEDSGAAAVVMFSLFEEQITHESQELDHFLSFGTESFAEALSYFPEQETYHVGPDGYLELIRKAKESVQVPIIANLNGVSKGGWTQYAKDIEQAGADALELNIYYIPTDSAVAGADIEQMYLDVVQQVKAAVKIPVAVKIGPFFSSMAHMAAGFAKAGADALVLFNRFYQPDFDLQKLSVEPKLVLSSQIDLRLPLHWTAILFGRVPLDLAVTSGVHTHEDVLKAVMAGASVTQMASELLVNGTGRIQQIVSDLSRWMTEYEYESIAQMKGSMSQQRVAEPAAFERANYMKELHSFRPDTTGLRI